MEFLRRRQDLAHQLVRHLLDVGIWAEVCRRADGPDRTSVAVLGAGLFHPGPVVAHEVSESPGFGVERVAEKGKVALGEDQHVLGRRRAGGARGNGPPAKVGKLHGRDQRPGVVVGAVAVIQIRRCPRGMLEHARVVSEQEHVSEVNAWKRVQIN